MLIPMAMLPIADILSTPASAPTAPRLKAGQLVSADTTPSASRMPTTRHIDAGIEVVHPSVALQKILPTCHWREVPSEAGTISNFQRKFLAARAALNPGFVHNMAHTNSARISNLYKEVPRFHNHLDLIA